MTKPIRTYVLRQGHMTKGQKQALSLLWDTYGLEVKNTAFDYSAVFKRQAPLILEIGFGMGEALISQAQLHPEYNFIGVEVHQPGVGKTLKAIDDVQLTNLRVFKQDIHLVLTNAIANSSLAGVNIFFPDPWPKKRHHKRRLINADFIKLLNTKLAQQGFLHIATDWQDYALQIATVMSEFTNFCKQADSRHRPKTKFETRGEKLGHAIFDFFYLKKQ